MSIQLGIWEGSNGGQLHSLEQETELSLSVPWRFIWGNQPPPPPPTPDRFQKGTFCLQRRMNSICSNWTYQSTNHNSFLSPLTCLLLQPQRFSEIGLGLCRVSPLQPEEQEASSRPGKGEVAPSVPSCGPTTPLLGMHFS